jgi:hypothetical protein
MEPTPFKQLPSELQKIITSSDTNVVIAMIATKFKLDEEKEADLGYLSTRLLLGLLPRNELEQNLSETLNIPKEIASSLAEELDMKVFAKVRTEIDTLYKNGTYNKTLSPSLPPPPPPPPGARRSIPTRDLRTMPTTSQTNTPSINYRPIQPAPTTPNKSPTVSIGSSSQGQPAISTVPLKKPEPLSFSKPATVPPTNLPIAQTQAPHVSPFNTPRMLPNLQKTPTAIPPQLPKPPIPTGPIADILSAKLTGTVQATNSEPTLTSTQKTSRGYGSVDPYRELPE